VPKNQNQGHKSEHVFSLFFFIFLVDILIEANEAGLEDLDEDALREALRGPLNELRDLLVNGISTVRTNRKDIAGSAIGGLGNLTGSIGLVADLLGLVFGLLTALMERTSPT